MAGNVEQAQGPFLHGGKVADPIWRSLLAVQENSGPGLPRAWLGRCSEDEK